VVLEVGRRRLQPGPETSEFVREVARMNFVAARLIVEILAAELELMRRSATRSRAR